MDVIFVNAVGMVVIGLIVWYFWLSRSEATAARTSGSGIQEAAVVVKGGYSPDTIRVEAGRPVRLTFHRQESNPCSERVVLDAFGISADLPEGRPVPLEFTPTEPGRHEFACQMGMLRGTVIVT